MRAIQLIGLVGLLSFSCKHGVDTDPVEAGKLLAVTSIISTLDTVLTAEVYRGQPLGKLIRDSLAVVADAEVKISNEGKELILTYDPAVCRYKANNPFRNAKEGAVFHLEVTDAAGLRVTAQSVLPPKPQEPVIDGQMIGEIRNPSLKSFKFTSSWENPSGYPYCTLWGSSTAVQEAAGEVFPLPVTVDLIQDVDRYPTDRQVSGKNVTTGAVWGASEAMRPFELSVILANVEESLFRYYRSYWVHHDWEINTENLFPDFREPAQIYSNVNGGVGLFASINCSVGTISVDPGQ